MKTTVKRNLVAGAAMTATIAMLAGCASAAPEAEPGAPAEPVSIVAMQMSDETGFPIWLAKELGYYEDNGLDVEFQIQSSGAAALAGGAAGDWQAGWIGGPPAISGWDKFGLIYAGTIIREDTNLKVLMRNDVLDGSTPAEVLRTVKVGTVPNSTFAYVLGACADHFGVSADEMEIVPLDAPQVRQALDAGHVGAGTTSSAADFEMVQDEDKYTVVCDGAEAGVSVVDPWIVTPSFFADNPDAAAGFIEAAFSANEYIVENPDEALDYMLKFEADMGLVAESGRAEYAMSQREWVSLDDALKSMTTGVTEDAVTKLAEYFVSAGVYESVPDIKGMMAAGLEVLEAAAEFRAAK